MGSNCVELMGSLGSGQIGEMGGNYSLSCFSEFAHSTSVGAAGIDSRTEIIHKIINWVLSRGVCVCGGGSLDECMTGVFPWLQRKHRICSQRAESLTTSPGEKKKAVPIIVRGLQHVKWVSLQLPRMQQFCPGSCQRVKVTSVKARADD